DLARADGPDAAFALGQHWLPGHAGAASHGLTQAGNVGEALTMLVQWQGQLCPLLAPRLVLGPDEAVLYWSDACGAPAQRNFLVDLHMSAVVALCQWLGGQRLPWQFCFNRPAPKDMARHEVYLGPRLRWSCQLDAMLLPRACLDTPWPRGHADAAAATQAVLLGDAAALASRRSVLVVLYDHLRDQIQAQLAPGLEGTAAAFGLSPASLKRLLARHGTHFQAELDQVRAHVALHLLHHEQCGNEQLAQYLGFHDATSFRRSFRRWTGCTPSFMRAHLLALRQGWIGR
ncbi:helix-turn-helix domain-containing protein, partial [Ideonella sp.]|uniref:helix-turn-helix domain-containing protein n=1 Tax=Ideonella sp. TaxID=1929293 RepID=UPI003BB53A4D